MKSIYVAYGALAIAIVLEVIGTAFLQKSQQFTQVLPTVVTAIAYIGAFFFLSVALGSLSLGIAYAIWAGLGIVLVAAIGTIVFRQTLDTPAMLGIGLIIAGVVVINTFSKSVTH